MFLLTNQLAEQVFFHLWGIRRRSWRLTVLDSLRMYRSWSLGQKPVDGLVASRRGGAVRDSVGRWFSIPEFSRRRVEISPPKAVSRKACFWAASNRPAAPLVLRSPTKSLTAHRPALDWSCFGLVQDQTCAILFFSPQDLCYYDLLCTYPP